MPVTLPSAATTPQPLSVPTVRGVREVMSRETGGPVRTWEHRITLTPEGPGTRYVDEIDIDAGVLTWFVAGFAALFYRYRQARWRRLVVPVG